MGVSIEGDDALSDEETIDVLRVNWDSVTAFLACQTQWRLALGMAGAVWLGLDYAAVDVVLRHRAAEAHVFDDLRVMEAEALKVLQRASK